jgi:hypothetical protein
MPDIHFDCPICNQSLEAPEDLANQLIDCPTCKTAIQVPSGSRRTEMNLESPTPPPLKPPVLTTQPDSTLSVDEDPDDEFEWDEPWRADPASDRQKQKLKYFGIRIKRGLTKGEASDLIEEAMQADPEREAAWQEFKEDEEGVDVGLSNLETLAWMVNDEDVREVCHYKVLTKAQLRQLLKYLKEHEPDWQSKSRYDLGDLVLSNFPEQAKAQGAKRPNADGRVKSGGCMLLLLAPFLLGCALLYLRLLSR